jgi:hypothetical protein
MILSPAQYKKELSSSTILFIKIISFYLVNFETSIILEGFIGLCLYYDKFKDFKLKYHYIKNSKFLALKNNLYS